MLEKAKKKLGLIFIVTEIICIIAIGLTTIITLNNLIINLSTETNNIELIKNNIYNIVMW